MNVRLALMFCLMCPLAGRAMAQTVTVTTGAVNGWVTDDSDASLPGVAVAIAGSAQMGRMETTTDVRGLYRFQNLPPGRYRLTYELAGLTTAASGCSRSRSGPGRRTLWPSSTRGSSDRSSSRRE